MTAGARQNKVHLVLCGGGVRVVSTIGAIRQLEEHGIEIASISGISAGSLLGALMCSGMSASELANWILHNNLMDHAGERKFSPRGALALFHAWKWPFAQYKTTGFPKLYTDLVRGDPTFSELKIPFMTASLDILGKRYEHYSKQRCPDMKVSDALRISTSVPVWYPPVQYEDKILVDVAVATRNPVWLTAELGDQLPILILDPGGSKPGRPDKLPDFLGALFGASMDSHDDYILSQIISRVPRIHTIGIECGDTDWHDFDMPRSDKEFLLEQGRIAMQQKMRELDGDLSRVDPISPAVRRPNEGAGQFAKNAMAKLMAEIPSNAFGTYKAFVSSTFQDLKEHRAHVINALQRAGIFVDPMEYWTSDNDEPKKLSVDRFQGCSLCILLVGLRRGHIPPGDTLSITEMEYEAALKANIDVLVYLLDQEAPWPHSYDELHNDDAVKRWRESLMEKHTVSFFGLEPSSLDISSGISRWLSEKLKMVHELAKDEASGA